MSVAVVFPGLAPSDYESVKAFVETSPYARQRYDEASEILGFNLQDAFAQADEDQWEVYQCAFLANSVALADWAENNQGMKPSLCVGASFGGVAAAVYTQCLTFREALLLTRESTLEEKQYFSTLEESIGTHFFYRVSFEKVQEMVQDFCAQDRWVEISAYLSDQIHAVCATFDTIEHLKKKIREEKGISLHTMKRPIHCSKLNALKERIRQKVYNRFLFEPLALPFVSDVDGALVKTPNEMKTALLDGYDYPVQWPKTIETLKHQQVKKAFVVGPQNLFGPLTKEHFEVSIVSPDMALERAGT